MEDREDLTERAADRAQRAARRTEELAERLVRLAAGDRASLQDVEDAEAHARASAEHARQAHDRAVEEHHRAADTHERVAELHDRAVLRGVGDQAEHRSAAARHRIDASADRDLAEEDEHPKPGAGR